MTSEDVIKTVAKKLKYYVDIKRREDGFDLSGPYKPAEEPMPQRAGPTLAYDGLHDRSLKHYFRNPEVKKQIGKMLAPSEPQYSGRNMDVRRIIDKEMSKRSYTKNLGSNSPYLSPSQQRIPRQRPRALISVDEYLKTNRGSKQRKIKPNYVGRPKDVLRRSPPRNISKNERERLIDMAARLIVATETAALPGNQSTQSKLGSMYQDSLTSVNSRRTVTEESSDSELIIPTAVPRPPSRAGGPRPRWTPPRVKTRNEQNKNSDEKHRLDKKKEHRPRTANIGSSEKSQQCGTFKQRPNSARMSKRDKNNISNGQQPNTSYHYTREKSDSSSRSDISDSEATTFRQTGQDEIDSPKLFHKRSPQRKNNSKYRIITYQVYVITGDSNGSASNANMKLTLFGENSSSGERPLLKSLNHAKRFQNRQVDIFAVDSVYLGKLHNIRIGHTQSSPDYGWYLETVYISEGPNEKTIFEFPCHRWFSSQKDDGQIVRDVSLAKVISDYELDKRLRDYKTRATGNASESYSSSSLSDDSDKTVEENDVSSGNHKSRERKPNTKQSRSRRTRKNDGENKRVSFKGNNKHSSDSDWDISEEERGRNSSRSSSEDSTRDSKKEGTQRRKAKKQYSNDEHSLDENLGNDNFKNKEDIGDGLLNGERSNGERSDGERSDGGNEGGLSDNGSTHGEDQGVKSSVDDDFWSNDGDKPEQIYYDLGVKEDKTTSLKSDNETKEDRSVEKSADGGSNKEYMAGFLAGVKARQHENEATHSDKEKDTTNEDEEHEKLVLQKGPSIHVAVIQGQVEIVKEMVEKKPSVKRETDEKGWTPLHVGCANGQVGCVKLLAVNGDNLEEETPTGYTSMHLAAMNGHVNCMMVLFALGAEINRRTIDEHTPLHLAAMSGHVESVKWLLANRAKFDAKDSNGRTAAEIAEEYCYNDVGELLISFKNEINRGDSTLAHLMTYEGGSKVADSGIGVAESGEESWISDNEVDETKSEKSSQNSRPSSAKKASDNVVSRNRTDSITTKEEKQKLYEKQRQQMKKRHSSFLDSIRMDVEEES